jgi:hypothetical protein
VCLILSLFNLLAVDAVDLALHGRGRVEGLTYGEERTLSYSRAYNSSYNTPFKSEQRGPQIEKGRWYYFKHAGSKPPPNRNFLVASIATEHKHIRTIFA